MGESETISKSDSWNLIRNTTTNTSLLSFLVENRVLSAEDVSKLESIRDEFVKSKQLYQLLATKTGWYSHVVAALQEGCQTGALEILQRLGGEKELASIFGGETQGKADSIRFDVINPVLNFTGRESQLEELHQKLQQRKTRGVMSQMASIVGLGGIGKTELARKYIKKYSSYFYDGNVIWISAQTEETLRESFQKLASNRLNISLTNVDNKEMDITTIVSKVYDYFKEKRALFVFDNAESTDYLQKFLFEHTSSIYSLITSRDRDWRLSVPVLELVVMTIAEAIIFVKNSLESDDDDDDQVLKLVIRLQHFPLALSQAVSFIKQRKLLGNYSISEYLQKFEDNSEKLLDSGNPAAVFNTYRETTLTTWRVTTQQIFSSEKNGRCAMNILNSIAYFRSIGIPIKLFANLDEYKEALLLLMKYSMLNVQRDKGTVSVHRLVQEVTRIQLKKNNEETQSLQIALKLFPSNISDYLDIDFVYHGVSVFKFSCDVNLSPDSKQLPWRIVQALNVYTRVHEAETVGNELRSILCKLVSFEDPNLLKLNAMLAATAYDLENNLESHLKMLEQFHRIYAENKENSFSKTELLELERLLVKYFKKLGHNQKALQLSRDTFTRHMLCYGLDEWQTIATLVNLAEYTMELGILENQILLSGRGRLLLAAAVPVLKQAHEINLNRIGKNFFWTRTMVSLGILLCNDQDTYYGSIILNDVVRRTSIDRDIRYYGSVLNCRISLAKINESRGEYEEMLVNCQYVYSRLVMICGAENKLSLEAQEKLATAFLHLGNLEAAIETYTNLLKILKMKKELPHPDHPLNIHIELVDTLCVLEESEENLKLLERMRTKIETEFGGDHPLLETLKAEIYRLSPHNGICCGKTCIILVLLFAIILFVIADCFRRVLEKPRWVNSKASGRTDL